jgi:hypothetical protein
MQSHITASHSEAARAHQESTYNPTAKAADDVSVSEDSDWDPDQKPCLPYRKGFVISALRHEPPEPFGMRYNTKTPAEQKGWKNMSQTEYCVSRPPLEGRTVEGVRQSLCITSTLRTGHHRGAQIVVVDKTMVAKIYDPLYYSALNDCGTQDDVVIDADGDYCREAAAYEQLQKSAAVAAVIPAFYGTWTIDVETPIKRRGRKKTKVIRAVRMILIERIFGDCMDNVDAYDLRERIRSMILKKTLVADAIVSDADVYHGDICPRNVMILGSDYDDPDIPICDIKVEVKIIDFNVAAVLSHPRYGLRKYMDLVDQLKIDWPSKMRSPIVDYFGHIAEFSTEGWCSNKDMEPERWLWAQFHDDERFVPVLWDPNNPNKAPEYQELPVAHQCAKIDSALGNTLDGSEKEDDDSSSSEHNGSNSSEEKTKENSSDDGSVDIEQHKDGEIKRDEHATYVA